MPWLLHGSDCQDVVYALDPTACPRLVGIACCLWALIFMWRHLALGMLIWYHTLGVMIVVVYGFVCLSLATCNMDGVLGSVPALLLGYESWNGCDHVDHVACLDIEMWQCLACLCLGIVVQSHIHSASCRSCRSYWLIHKTLKLAYMHQPLNAVPVQQMANIGSYRKCSFTYIGETGNKPFVEVYTLKLDEGH